MGGGSSELKAVWAEMRALNARVVACEQDCIRLSRSLLKLGPEVTLDDVAPLAVARDGSTQSTQPAAPAVAVAGPRESKVGAGSAGKRKR